MIFNSVTYLVFLCVAVCLYWLLPRKPRLWMLFIASLCFYGFWRVEFIPVMMASTLIDYFAAQRIHASSNKTRRRMFLALSLLVNLGLLFFFKYLFFFAENAVGVFNLLGAEIAIPEFFKKIILPLGISFYTFQTISYTIDVYRGFIKPERDFVLYGCYVIFFPQLVAGPILRANEVILQLDKRPTFEWVNLGMGLRRILLGLFLKVVLADNIAPLVDAGYAMAAQTPPSALDVWTLAFLFGFQIYFDFSAYSHIAIGSARMMGIHFPENFNYPYLANSPRDFWRRWHISLSSWIRDYLYLPLTGAQVHDRSTGGLAEAVEKAQPQSQPAHPIRGLFLTWAIMGLWHGANWTFICWGLYHALFIFAYRRISELTKGLPRWVSIYGGWALTLPITMLSWIFFRCDSLPQAFSMYAKVLDPRQYFSLGLRENAYLVTALLLAGAVVSFAVQTVVLPYLRRRPVCLAVAEAALFTVVIALVFVFLRPIYQFIYFQF